MKKGFTLIELLIVVAIIAILAAIAVPNFIEAQTRAKISRAKADMRSIETALESYAVDNNTYPGAYQFGSGSLRTIWGAAVTVGTLGPVGTATTPISYITSLPSDPFGNFLATGLAAPPGFVPFLYDKAGFGFETTNVFPNTPNTWSAMRTNGAASAPFSAGFVVQLPVDYMTNGLDANGTVSIQERDINATPRRYCLWSIGPSNDAAGIGEPGSRYKLNYRYDPTNGTTSKGFILRYSGGPSFP